MCLDSYEGDLITCADVGRYRGFGTLFAMLTALSHLIRFNSHYVRSTQPLLIRDGMCRSAIAELIKAQHPILTFNF